MSWSSYGAYRARQPSQFSVSSTAPTPEAEGSSSNGGEGSATSGLSSPIAIPTSSAYGSFGSSSNSGASYSREGGITAFRNTPSSTGSLRGLGTPPPPSSGVEWPQGRVRSSPFSLATSPSPRSQRRLSSTLSSGPASGAGGTTPFGSLVGSYENSLLAGRLSALPSLPMPFVASIGVLGSSDAPTKLRCPPHVSIPFGAFFYAGPEGSHEPTTSSPYVGTIDLEAHYTSLLASHATSSSTLKSTLPRFPGYRVPERGQLQVMIKNGNSSAIKLFLVQYDLAGLSRQGQGGKTFLRQKSYTVEVPLSSSTSSSTSTQGSLRYAIHLQFCCPPTSPGKSPFYYLHQTIRVVFASSCALDLSERLRVVYATPGQPESASAPSPSASPIAPGWSEVERWSPYRGPGPEWEMAKRKAKAREKIMAARREDQEEHVRFDEQGDVDIQRQQHFRSDDLDTPLATSISSSISIPTASPPYFTPPPQRLLSTPPSSSPPPILSLATLSHALPPLLSKRSALSISRPPSREGTPTPPPQPPGGPARSRSAARAHTEGGR